MVRRGTAWAMVGILSVAACSKAAPETSSDDPAVASRAGIAGQTALAAPSATSQAAPANEDGQHDRSIVQSAELGIEASDPTGAAKAAGVITEELGGHVASSDRSLRTGEDESTTTVVNMVLRVPSARFTTALARLEKLGSRTLGQKVQSEDVTDDVIDVRARLTAQRALELQFLEILKQAKSVKDALEVNAQLAEVRTGIEKMEGKRRILEQQVSSSTIKVTIEPSAPLVRAGHFAFGESLARAGADLVNVSAVILHGAIRALGVAIPILAFIAIPGILFLRGLFRRMRRAPAA